jgi:tetratricopeptide (TPR) repeat protein
MRPPRVLILLACLLAVSACTALGTEDRGRLTLYLENAAQYYDQRHYERAYQQWGKALDVDPLNDKARLGQAMAMYQLGLEESPLGVDRLTAAEERLDELRNEDLDGLEWQAELGFALVMDRWVDLYARKVRQLRYQREVEGATDEEELAIAEKELDKRARIAERAYRTVKDGGEREAQYQLACLIGLAKMTAYRGEFQQSLGHARAYEEQIVRSKRLWRDAAERFPREAALWEAKLDGANRQEAELRDLIANVLFKLGRYTDAESELDVVLEIDPERASAYLNRGIMRQERKDWDRARQDFRTFLAMTARQDEDPSVIEARRRLEEVEARVEEEDAAAVERAREGG